MAVATKFDCPEEPGKELSCPSETTYRVAASSVIATPIFGVDGLRPFGPHVSLIAPFCSGLCERYHVAAPWAATFVVAFQTYI